MPALPEPHDPKQTNYLIETILPAREVHLLGGPSGAGKTTWLFQTIEEWEQAKPILGFQSYPVPWMYVSADRSAASTKRTLERMDMLHMLRPRQFFSMVDMATYTVGVDGLKALLKEKFPGGGLVIVDGFQSLVGGKLIDYGVVADFLRQLQRYCTHQHYTIIGICHSAKTKEGERYKNPRERVGGSAAWAGYSDTIFYVEAKKPDDPKCTERELVILPRNSAGFHMPLEFNDRGRLFEPDADTVNLIFDLALSKLKPGELITTAAIYAWDTGGKISKATADRWIGKTVHAGRLERTKKGTYRIPFQN